MMPAVQTTYATTLSPAYLGMTANGEWVTNIISRIVDPATPRAIGFGEPVLQGASEQLVLSPNGTGAFRGIAVRDPTLPPADNDQYQATRTIAVMTNGVVWVGAAAAVTAGAPVYLTAAGALTGTATGNTLVANAVWDSTTGVAAPAKLRLN